MHAMPLLALAALLAGCAPGGGSGTEGDTAQLPGNEDTQPFDAVSEAERLRFVGTEPFWGGEVTGTRLTYSTPEQPDGTVLEVERFAGRGGLSYSGALAGSSFDLALAQGECSDGMSDRIYPFTVTLKLGQETRYGCGWTEARPFREPPLG
jgi:uncharacterized membrane protein